MVYYASNVSPQRVVPVDLSDPRHPKELAVWDIPAHGGSVSDDGTRGYFCVNAVNLDDHTALTRRGFAGDMPEERTARRNQESQEASGPGQPSETARCLCSGHRIEPRKRRGTRGGRARTDYLSRLHRIRQVKPSSCFYPAIFLGALGAGAGYTLVTHRAVLCVCLAWGRFATCLRMSTAGCKPAPRKANAKKSRTCLSVKGPSP